MKNPYAFENWMTKVDDTLLAICGLGYGDLADQPFYDWFADGVSPKTAAKRVLRDEGFPA